MPLPPQKDRTDSDESRLHHLEILAAGIAGRAVPVISKPLKPDASYTDIRSIFVPQGTPVEQLFDQVISQACLLRAGSLRREFAEAIIGRRPLAFRYLFAEIARCVREYEAILPRRFCAHSAFASFSSAPSNCQGSLDIARSNIAFPPIPSFLGIPRPRTTLAYSARYEIQGHDWLTDHEEQRIEQVADAGSSYDDLNAARDETADPSPDPQIAGGRLTEILRKILGLGDGTKLERSTASRGARSTLRNSNTRPDGVPNIPGHPAQAIIPNGTLRKSDIARIGPP